MTSPTLPVPSPDLTITPEAFTVADGLPQWPALVPCNGQPLTLAEVVEHEAMGYRAGELRRETSSHHRWNVWRNCSAGQMPGRHRLMRIGCRSGSRRSATSGSRGAIRKASKPVAGTARLRRPEDF